MHVSPLAPNLWAKHGYNDGLAKDYNKDGCRPPHRSVREVLSHSAPAASRARKRSFGPLHPNLAIRLTSAVSGSVSGRGQKAVCS